MVILALFLVISVNRRLFRYFGSYFGYSGYFGKLSNPLFGVLFEGKCFKFFYEFFYGVFKVGLNTEQNSPATHCCAT